MDELFKKRKGLIVAIVATAAFFIVLAFAIYVLLLWREIKNGSYTHLFELIILLVAILVVFAIMGVFVYMADKYHQQKAKEALAELLSSKQETEKQLKILQSMADAYYSMHLFDLDLDSLIEYESRNQVKDVIEHNKDVSGSEVMRRVMDVTMSESYMKIGLEFSDITTLKERLKGKKFISMDLRGRNVGWIRMVFITIEADAEGVPHKVICTTQIIEEEKKREELLMKESHTDALTGCLNRRAYEKDLLIYPDIPTEENFVYVAMDLNGLKVTNDNLGHNVGDELILAAVKCMNRCIGNYGRIYRTGGDEFVAMIFADEKDLQAIQRDFEEQTEKWQSENLSGVSVSCGYVTKREFPDMRVVDMAKIADKRMYEAKAEYYRQKGIDRRGNTI